MKNVVSRVRIPAPHQFNTFTVLDGPARFRREESEEYLLAYGKLRGKTL